MQGRRRKLGFFVVLLAVAFVTLAAGPVLRLVRAVEFLSSLAAPEPAVAQGGARVVEEDVRVPSGKGSIRARLYFRQDEPRGAGIVVAHGVHHDGIDEKRLVPFARALART